MLGTAMDFGCNYCEFKVLNSRITHSEICFLQKKINANTSKGFKVQFP